MNRRFFFYCLSVMVFVHPGGLFAHNVNDSLIIQEQKPEAGTIINFEYDAAGGKLAKAKDIRAALFYYVAGDPSSSYGTELGLENISEDKWKGSFMLPDSAVAFALRFKSAQVTDDHNGKGYVSVIYKNGQPPAGAYGSVGLLYDNGAWLLGLSNNPDTVIKLLKKEFIIHPDQEKNFETAYYTNLISIKQKEAFPEIEKRIAELLSGDASADQYQKAIQLYVLERKLKAADSLLLKGSIKYPKSDMEIEAVENQFYQAEQLDSQLLRYASFQQQFDVSDPESIAGKTLSYLSFVLVDKFIGQKEYRKAVEFANKIVSRQFEELRARSYDQIAQEILKDSTSTDFGLADTLAQAALAVITAQYQHPEIYKYHAYTLSDWKAERQRNYEGPFNDTYGSILARKGQYKTALECQQKTIDMTGTESPMYNQHYIEYLVKNGNLTTAGTKEQEFISAAFATQRVKELFKEDYIRKYGSSKGFDELLYSLEEKSRKKMLEELLAQKLDIPAKPFSVSDQNGYTVSLSSLKGKVVVLDFWASWCTPCKASFPAMQKAIKQFSADTNVVFLFVNTFESSLPDLRLKYVKDFISNHHYSFRVLFDKKANKASAKYSMASDYDVESIPTKFVLNPNGHIVFREIGFDGNDDKLINEVVAMIGMAQK